MFSCGYCNNDSVFWYDLQNNNNISDIQADIQAKNGSDNDDISWSV